MSSHKVSVFQQYILKKRKKAFLLISTISLVFSWINYLLEDLEVFPGGTSGKNTQLPI